MDKPEFYAVYWKAHDAWGNETIEQYPTLREAQNYVKYLLNDGWCKGVPRIARFVGEWVT